MAVIIETENILVALGIFTTLAYHIFLYNTFKHNPLHTSLGIESSKRKSWFFKIKQGDDKTGMLAVQSLRNKKMVTIFTSSITILIFISLASLSNNAFKAKDLFQNTISGSKNPTIFVLKYASAAFVLIVSFFCSSVSLSYLIDAIFLINAIGGEEDCCGCVLTSTTSFRVYTRMVLERGILLSVIGSRLMCVSLPILLWMFGPLPVIVSSLGLVSVLYQFDFPVIG